MKVTNRITNPNITILPAGGIFVFGSNESGIHGAGAARLALIKFEARHYQGFGLQGKCFAIPTKDFEIEKLPLTVIEHYVSRFIAFAKIETNYQFHVTAIGCGLAGYAPEDIAPLFKNAVGVDNILLPVEFIQILEKL